MIAFRRLRNMERHYYDCMTYCHRLAHALFSPKTNY